MNCGQGGLERTSLTFNTRTRGPPDKGLTWRSWEGPQPLCVSVCESESDRESKREREQESAQEREREREQEKE